jgi:acyl-CoA dehydrogenase
LYALPTFFIRVSFFVMACFESHNSPVLTKSVYQVEKFVEEECIPADAVFARQIGETTEQRFSSHPPVMEELKAKAKKLGLWNMFLPKNHFKEGAGFSNLEYGLMAEYLGKSRTASEVCIWS